MVFEIMILFVSLWLLKFIENNFRKYAYILMKNLELFCQIRSGLQLLTFVICL